MSNDESDKRILDKVYTHNLVDSLKYLGIEMDEKTADLLIDLVEVLAEKGDEISIKELNLIKEQHLEEYNEDIC